MARKTNKEVNGYKYFRTSLFLGYKPNGKKHIKEFYGKSQSEADAKKEAYIKGGKIETSNITLGNGFLNWLENVIRISGITHTSYDAYYLIYKNDIVGSKLEWLRIDSIKAVQIEEYYSDMFKNGKSYAKISKLNKMLKRYFKYCLVHELISDNPCEKVTIPMEVKRTKQTKEIEIFTNEEMNKIIKEANAKYPIYGCIIELLFKLGARQGEILGLKRSNVFDDKLLINSNLKAEKDYSNNKMVLVLNQTKNNNSIREIFFGEEIKKILKKAKALQNEQRLINVDYKNDYDLVFTTSTGNPINARNLLRFWTRLLKRLKIDYRDMHTIRHTFISNCAKNGIELKIVQKIVGHGVGSKITESIYTHYRKEEIKENMLRVIK